MNKQEVKISKKTEIELTECPVWGDKHKWSVVFCKHPDGKVWYCQFCFIEKLVCYDNESNGWLKQYFAKGSYYERTFKTKNKVREQKDGGSVKAQQGSNTKTTETQQTNSVSKNWDED